MDQHEQARLLSTLADMAREWENAYCFQLQEVCDSPHLTPEGRALMDCIGEYADRNRSSHIDQLIAARKEADRLRRLVGRQT